MFIAVYIVNTDINMNVEPINDDEIKQDQAECHHRTVSDY